MPTTPTRRATGSRASSPPAPTRPPTPLAGIPTIDSWQPYRDGGSSYASEDDAHRAGVSLALAVPTKDASGSTPASREALLYQAIPYDPWEEAPSLHFEWA